MRLCAFPSCSEDPGSECLLCVLLALSLPKATQHSGLPPELEALLPALFCGHEVTEELKDLHSVRVESALLFCQFTQSSQLGETRTVGSGAGQSGLPVCILLRGGVLGPPCLCHCKLLSPREAEELFLL